MSATTWVVLLAGPPVVALAVHRYLVCVVVVRSGSMEPTLWVGDRLLVCRVAYAFGHPRRGDIVVFSLSGSARARRTIAGNRGAPWLVKRVAAGDGAVVVGRDQVPTVVSPGFVFVTGDNESVSRDSHEFGPIPVDDVIGKAFLAYGGGRGLQRLGSGRELWPDGPCSSRWSSRRRLTNWFRRW